MGVQCFKLFQIAGTYYYLQINVFKCFMAFYKIVNRTLS